MDNNKNLLLEDAFNLAIKNHQENNLNDAQDLYNQVLKINPNHSGAYHNLGVIFDNLKKYQKAKECYEKVIEINPNHSGAHTHYNLGNIFQKLKKSQKAKECYEKAIEINPNHSGAHYNLGAIFDNLKRYQKAKECYEKTIKINPNYLDAYNNLGNIFQKLKKSQKAKECYEKAIEINPNYIPAYNNLGAIFNVSGEYQKAKDCYEKAIKVNPNYADARYNLGTIFDNLGEYRKAKECFEKVIEIDPNYTGAYWNLHGTAPDINEALLILKKLYKINNKHTKAKIMISALEGYKGNFNMFNDILKSSNSNHPYTRSIKWVFSLPKLPKIFFNRWFFFDAVIKLTDNSRPFYEFGVWNGVSFQYLIDTFKKGFGFDTFNGIPEDWHNEPKGSYSSFGVVPKIEGGEFIVGKFEDTLSGFFSKEKPMASLINFDADLYSSTLCALNNSNKVIDEKTILIFDELILNDKWEEDEFKALNEFCDNLGYNYEVIAISFFSKQVAVKIKKK
jgi:tetratricopeptide (TPR) repeat protein